ncbi:MAG: hypothetical protein COA42_09710 [Alteromonadaceae bacterium]|nr:MAG: hypothetical protein COA42_09710 [Alteromonadaceae bacterium]
MARGVARCVLLALSLVISACGWQLRGGQLGDAEIRTLRELSVHNHAKNKPLYLALKDEMLDRGMTLTNTSEYTLVINQVQLEKRPQAFGSTGLPVQYQLLMSVNYHYLVNPATDPNSEHAPYVTENSTFISRRTYDFDTELIAAKNKEELDLLQEMRYELVRRLIAKAPIAEQTAKQTDR